MIEEPHLANQFEDQLEGKYQEVMRNSAPARHGYDTAEQFQLDEECRLKAAIIQLAELNNRAMAIISDAIMHGMPITEEVADVRNQIVCSNEATGKDPMNKSTELAAGQWWLHSNGKPMLIVFDDRTIGSESGLPIVAYENANMGDWYKPSDFVRRLPDDAGFDYKPEPEVVFPQYCIPIAGGITTCHNKQVAFWTFDDNEHGRTFHTDGTSFPFGSGNFKDDRKRAVTKTEAEARLNKPIPEIVFDPETFTSDWGPFPEQHPDRWFIWSDNRYPIAFVKHASGQVFNLNVDSILKQSDDWDGGYEEQLANGELVEVTEFSAKAFLKRPRSASQIPKHEPPKPNRIPVRLYWYYGNVVACFAHSPPTDPSFVEIKLDPQMIISGSGFYVEGTGK